MKTSKFILLFILLIALCVAGGMASAYFLDGWKGLLAALSWGIIVNYFFKQILLKEAKNDETN